MDALIQGDQLRRAGKLPEALTLLQQSTDDLPKDSRAWNALGLAYHASGRLLEAQRAYIRARAEDPNFFEAHYNLGVLFSEQGEWLEVERSFRAFLAVDANRNQVTAWRLLGEAQWHNRAYDQAQHSLAVAAKGDPKNPDVWNLLGLVEVARRHFPEARQNFAYALYLAPHHPSALLNLAVVTQQYPGDKKAAAALYREYLNAVPAAPNAEAIRALIRQLESSPVSPAPTELRRASVESRAATNLTVLMPSLPPVAAASPVVPHPPPTNRAPAKVPGTTVSSTAGFPSINPGATPPLSSSNLPSPATVPSVLPPTSPASASVSSPVTNFIAPPSPVSVPQEVVRVEDNKPLGEAPLVVPPPKTVPMPSRSASDSDSNVSRAPEPMISDRTATTPAPATTNASAPVNPDGGSDRARPGFWQRVNPVRWGNPIKWFSGSSGEPEASGSGTRLTVSPEPIPPPARLKTGSIAGRPVVPSAAVVRRYPRAFPSGLVPGDRSLAENQFAAGSEAYDRGDRAGAVAYYRQAALADPTFFPAQYNLSVVAYSLGDDNSALHAAEAAVLVDPLSVQAHRAFSAALIRAGYPQDAVEELQKWIQLQPRDVDPQLAAAGIYANQLGDSLRARPLYQRVLELSPDHPQAALIKSWLADH